MRKRVQSLAGRYMSAVAALLVMLVCSIGVLSWNASRHTKLAREATGSYLMALQQIDRLGNTNGHTPNEHTGASTKSTAFNNNNGVAVLLNRVVASGVGGVSTLAKMQQAALAAESGQKTKALALWNAIQANSAVAPALRDVASFLWCQQQIDTGDPAVLRSRLFVLLNKGKAWKGLVTEELALLDIREGHRDAARQKLASLLTLENIPDGVRHRAQMLIQALNAPA